MRGFAPAGTELIQPVGLGSVFEVAVVRGGQGQVLICKRAAPRLARTPAGEAALGRERALLEALKSPYLPALAGAGADARGGFLLETRAPGFPLRALVGENEHVGPLWPAIAAASTHALASLHALRDETGDLGFVHGDISPDNLFFAPPATVTLVDLSSATWRGGLAPVFAADRGTLPYAAPELARGSTAATRACDTYALAATLLYGAVGPPLTRGQTEAARLLEVADHGILRARIDERTDLPDRARRALFSALSHDPSARLGSARELAHELTSAVAPPTG